MVRTALFAGFALLASTAVAFAATPPVEHKQVAVDPKLFDGYVGYYQLAPTLVMTITRQDDHLLVRNTNTPIVEIFPESTKDYFYKEIPVRLSFETDRSGRATKVIVHGVSKDLTAMRITETAANEVEQVVRPSVEVAVDPKLFDSYVGRYQLSPNEYLTVTRDGDHLFAKPTGQPRYEIFAKGDRLFFLKGSRDQITFVPDRKGKIDQVVLHQRGKDMPANRVAESVAQKFEELTAKRLAEQERERTEIALDPKLIDKYVGRYQLRPDFVLTISHEGGHLFAQGTAQEQAEIFPENERDFFYKEAHIQITFLGNGRKANQVILHQAGQEIPAKRIE